MHNKTKLLIFASLLLAACSTDPMQEIPNRGDSAPEIETSGKICNNLSVISAAAVFRNRSSDPEPFARCTASLNPTVALTAFASGADAGRNLFA